MRELHGGCHCGTISYVLRWPLDGDLPVRRCACSFCAKQGALYAAHPDAALSVSVTDPKRFSRYRFGTNTADFGFCSNCGVFLFVTCTVDGRLFAVVNVNSLDEARVSLETAARNFDGESETERLARRSRGWIADVAINVVEARIP